MPKLAIVEVETMSRPSRTNGRTRTRRKTAAKKFPQVFFGVTLPENMVAATDINPETMLQFVDEMTGEQREEACATIEKMEEQRFLQMLQKMQDESSLDWLKDLFPSGSFTKTCVVITVKCMQ